VAGPRECGNKHLLCVNCGEFLDQLRNCQLLKENFFPVELFIYNCDLKL
jgi:hypothetical protein